MLFSDMNEAKRNMAPQNSTLINLINDDDVESITSERLSPIEKEHAGSTTSEEEVSDHQENFPPNQNDR